MHGRALLLAMTFLLAGCASPEAEVLDLQSACEGDADAVWDEARAWMADLGGGPVKLTVTGTFDGEPDELVLRVDPDKDAFALTRNGTDFRFEFPYYTHGGAGGVEGRDHDPRNSADVLVARLVEAGGLGVTVPDWDADDAEVSCGAVDGVDAVTFTFRNATHDETVHVADAPLRVLGGERSTPELDVTYRVETGRPLIALYDGLTRVPATVDLFGLAVEDAGDGLLQYGTMGEGTEWVPFSELHLVVLDGATFEEVGRYGFEPGRHGIDDGYYDLRDADGNGLLSEGDYLEVALPYELDFGLYDTWADAYASY